MPFHYVAHRMVDVGIGVVTGLVVNVLVFPPLQLRPAEHAIRQWGEDIAEALEDLSRAVADPKSSLRSWPRHDRQLTMAAEQARAATRRARDSLRWNRRPRPRRPYRRLTARCSIPSSAHRRIRAVAQSLPDAGHRQPGQDQASFGQDYATLLRDLAPPAASSPTCEIPGRTRT